MKLVFLDDSGQTNPVRTGLGALVALGAVIVDENQVNAFADDLAAIKAAAGVPATEEVKWKPPKGSFLADAGGEVVKGLRSSVLEAAARCGITSVVHVLDHSRAYRELGVVDVGQELLKWTYDKVSMAIGTDRAVMIADQPGGDSKEESRWLAKTLALTSGGTKYTAPGKVILPVLTSTSRHVPHLQLADIVTAATTAAIAGRPAGLALASQLRALARRTPSGSISGAGVKIWPPDLRDLLYWTFGETAYTRDGVTEVLGPNAATDEKEQRPFRESSGLASAVEET